MNNLLVLLLTLVTQQSPVFHHMRKRKRFRQLLVMSCCKQGIIQRDFLKYITAKKFRGLVGNVKKIEVLYYTPSFYKTLYFDFVPNNVNQKIFLSGCDGREMFVPSKLL